MASDETEDPLEARLETIQRRAENFRELLKDGEEVIIVYQDGEVHVDESYRSKFERQHSKLYGRMLALEAQMDAGWSPYVVALLIIGTFLFGLQLDWWTAILGETVCNLLNHWWFYVCGPLLFLYIARLGCSRWERHIYGRRRQDLLDLIRAESLDREVLIVTLRDEAGLENVVYQLKLDSQPAAP